MKHSELVERVANTIAHGQIMGWSADKTAKASIAIIPGTHGWQPIETAPVDASFIVCWNGRRFHVAQYDRVEGEFVSSFKTVTQRLIVSPSPSHWMPLPTPPQEMSE